MPPISRWSVRLAFLCLAAAMLVGLLYAARAALGTPSWVANLWPTFVHLLGVAGSSHVH